MPQISLSLSLSLSLLDSGLLSLCRSLSLSVYIYIYIYLSPGDIDECVDGLFTLKMTTIEKLFVQIFERKKWIIEQVKQQTDLYDQHLASKLLIDGITPPKWLWNPKLRSDCLDPKELKKEKLISELLLPHPHPRPAVPYSGGCCSLYNKSVITEDNGDLPNELFTETHTSNKGVDEEDGPTVVPECHDIDGGCALNCVPELDFSAASPQEQTDVRISNISTASDPSLARIQRSKSRQKALELRNSARTVTKSNHENNTGVSSSGFVASRFNSQPPDKVNDFLELSKLSDISSDNCEEREPKENCLSKGKGTDINSDRITRSRSSSVGFKTSAIASKKLDHVDEMLELAKPPDISRDSCVVRETKGDALSKEKGTDMYRNRITRSRSSFNPRSCVDESFKLDSSSDIAKKDVGRETRLQTTCSIEGISKPVNSSNIVGPRFTRSRSSESGKSPLAHSLNSFEGYDLQNVLDSQEISYRLDTDDIVKKEGSAGTATGTQHVSDGQALADCSGSNFDGARLRLEVLVSRRTSDLSMSVKPKQLEYDDVEKCTLNETFSPKLEKKMLAKSSEDSTLVDPAASLNELASVDPDRNYQEKQSLVQRKVSNKAGEAQGVSFEAHVEECVEVDSNVNENPMLKSIENTLVDPAAPLNELASDDPDRNSLEKQPLVERKVSNKAGEAQGVSFVAHVEECADVDSNVNENPILKIIENTLVGPAASLNEFASDDPDRNSPEKQSLVEQKVSNKAGEAQGVSFEAHVEECADVNSKVNENPMLKSTENTLVDPAASVNELSSDDPVRNYPEKQSLVEWKVSNKAREAKGVSFEAHVQECVDTDSNISENRVLKGIEDNLDAVLHIQQSPVSHEVHDKLPSVDKGPAEEIHQSLKFHLTEGFESSPDTQIKEAELGYEGRSKTTPFTFKHKQLGPSIVSSLTKQEAGDSQGCVVEEAGMTDPTSIVVDNQNLLHPEDKLDWRSKGIVASDERNLQERRKTRLVEGSLFEYGSVGSVHNEEKNASCINSEFQVAKKSFLPQRSLSSAMQDSWPQFKRRKIEGQQTKFFSASPSCRVERLHSIERGPAKRYLRTVENAGAVPEFKKIPVSHEVDARQSNVYENPDVEMHQAGKCILAEENEPSPKLELEEDLLGSEERNKRTYTPFTFTHVQLGPSPVSRLAKQVSSDSSGCPVGGMVTEDSTNANLDARRGYNEQDYHFLLHSENNVNMGNTVDLTCTERTLEERKPHLGEDGLFSYGLVESPQNKHLDLIGADQTLPVFEGFILDAQGENGQHHIAGYGINFDKLELPDSTIERASFLEQLCKSASMHNTPLSHFSATFKSHKTPELYQSVPNGLLERMELKSTLPLNDDGGMQFRASYSCDNEFKCAFEGVSYSDCLPHSNQHFGWNLEKPYMSPVGKLWESLTSNLSSSEKKRSLNPELTCFPIEEDPSISEENENTDDVADTIQEGISSVALNSGAKREPLAEITEDPPALISAAKIFPDRESLDSINTEGIFTGTRNRVKQSLGNRHSNKRCTNEAKENQNLSVGVIGVKKAAESLHNRYSKPKLSGKASLRKGGQSLSERESKRNNIVSNISSFVPLVQQKQAAAVCTGKRDIKVKALEAAGAAKRLEAKRENERKMKKEALKLERARMEQENLRQMEIKKKKNEEERKKKEVDVAARKRLREEEDRKEKERKRKRIEETRRQQREHGEKLHTGKGEKEVPSGAIGKKVNSGKEFNDESEKHRKMEKERGDDNIAEKPETELKTAGLSTSDVRQASILSEDCGTSTDCGDIEEAMIVSDKSPEKDDRVNKTSREKSYEISPYQCSDDEDEEEDDMPTRKFIPSWASKNVVALVLSSQQEVDPDVIFPQESFCSMDEVLLPRKLLLK
ncbi:uncharacterized protein LOC132312277 [Cornus florida]|uniref:uncharacterized protein LOC132312277 n=1 Tax=Cornus florida TaxID=4283 RepID=UPI00289F2205|nr:uncharacterized protein LOC132312277 [Cornus florida]